LSYFESPAEIWRGYWRIWKQSRSVQVLVSLAVAFGGLVAGGLCYLDGQLGLHPLSRDSGRLAVGVGLVVAVLLFLALPVFLAFFTSMFRRQVTFHTGGMAYYIGESKSRILWRMIIDIRDDGEYVLVIGGGIKAIAIPYSAFSGLEQRRALLQTVQSHIKLTPSQLSQPAPSSPIGVETAQAGFIADNDLLVCRRHPWNHLYTCLLTAYLVWFLYCWIATGEFKYILLSTGIPAVPALLSWLLGPRTIRLDKEGNLTFEAFLWRKTVKVSEVISIKRWILTVISHRRGLILLAGRYVHFDDLLLQLKRMNPSMTINMR
jgi:hypothetical protein